LNRAQLERHLRDHECELLRHGARHDVWMNRRTRAISTLPRHREIPSGTTRSICRDLGVELPGELK
jgi:mRNA interferase HicA